MDNTWILKKRPSGTATLLSLEEAHCRPWSKGDPLWRGPLEDAFLR